MQLENNDNFPKLTYQDWLNLVISDTGMQNPEERLKHLSLEEVEYPGLVLQNKHIIPLQTFPQECHLLKATQDKDTHVYYPIENWQNSNGHFEPLVQKAKNLQRIQINTDLIHNAGASAVDELTAALSIAMQFVGKKIIFVMAVGSRHYLSIAKLRALRFLWERFCSENHLPMDFEIQAVTSLREYTLFDSWNNQLRSTCSAAAAILGGANSLKIWPRDILTHLFEDTQWNEQSTRLAENIYHILQKESHMGKVLDAAGGSFAIENLTNQLIETVYARLIQHEKDNYHNYWLDLPAKVEQLAQKRYERIQKMQDIITGINSYSDPNEKFLDGNEDRVYYPSNKGKFPLRRLAHEFESLRISFEKLAPQLHGVILCQGDRKALTARINFCKNYFETVGIQMHEHFWQQQDLQSVVSGASLVVLCAQDEEYAEFMPVIYPLIALTKHIFVAGKPAAELLEKYPVESTIQRGQNVYEVLSNLLKGMME